MLYMLLRTCGGQCEPGEGPSRVPAWQLCTTQAAELQLAGRLVWNHCGLDPAVVHASGVQGCLGCCCYCSAGSGQLQQSALPRCKRRPDAPGAARLELSCLAVETRPSWRVPPRPAQEGADQGAPGEHEVGQRGLQAALDEGVGQARPPRGGVHDHQVQNLGAQEAQEAEREGGRVDDLHRLHVVLRSTPCQPAGGRCCPRERCPDLLVWPKCHPAGVKSGRAGCSRVHSAALAAAYAAAADPAAERGSAPRAAQRQRLGAQPSS